MSLTKRILIAMALGIVTGVIINTVNPFITPSPAGTGSWLQTAIVEGLFDAIGKVFVASLKLLVVPLVLVSLVCGTASLGNSSRMGMLAGKTILLYLLTTGIAIGLAIMVASIVQPGVGMNLEAATQNGIQTGVSVKDTFINIFPSNPIQAMAEGNMLQVIVFALLLGIAISKTGDSAKPLLAFFNSLNEVVLKMVLLLMYFAPFGIFCLLAKLFANTGFEIIKDLLSYFLTVLGVLLLHGLVVYTSLLRFIARLSPIIFLRKMRSVMIFGFSTASSNATLPITLRTVQEELGVDTKVASFTIPLGATINMDGTAIMQGVATVFIAQAYGIDVGITGYLLVILTATLASIGAAGVPGVGMITLAMVLQQAGLPIEEGIALIIGVDRLLDMVRTAVNVTGDAAVSTVVANSEKMLDRDRFNRKPRVLTS